MIFSPSSPEELASLLKAQQSPLHLTGSKNEHSGVDTLSLSKLNSVLLYEPEEMIISVGAGITLKELERTLSERGQWIPTLVADEVSHSTLGAAIASDEYNPRARSMGMLRTAILGGTFCTTAGEIFKSGSRVVKSVAGYDIHRAFCGSQGLFGAILAVTLKVQPRPEKFFRLNPPVEFREKSIPLAPTVLEVVNNELILELAGYAEDIEADIQTLRTDGMIANELNQVEWIEAIGRIREEHPKAGLSEEEKALYSRVRAVFDPKGILV